MTVARPLAATVSARIVQASVAANHRAAVRSAPIAGNRAPGQEADHEGRRQERGDRRVRHESRQRPRQHPEARRPGDGTGSAIADGSPPPVMKSSAARVSEKSLPSSWTASGT